jgi:hypothetical protein
MKERGVEFRVQNSRAERSAAPVENGSLRTQPGHVLEAAHTGNVGVGVSALAGMHGTPRVTSQPEARNTWHPS